MSEQTATICRACGAPERYSPGPRTYYKCNSSQWDNRPGSFQQSLECQSREADRESYRSGGNSMHERWSTVQRLMNCEVSEMTDTLRINIPPAYREVDLSRLESHALDALQFGLGASTYRMVEENNRPRVEALHISNRLRERMEQLSPDPLSNARPFDMAMTTEMNERRLTEYLLMVENHYNMYTQRGWVHKEDYPFHVKIRQETGVSVGSPLHNLCVAIDIFWERLNPVEASTPVNGSYFLRLFRAIALEHLKRCFHQCTSNNVNANFLSFMLPQFLLSVSDGKRVVEDVTVQTQQWIIDIYARNRVLNRYTVSVEMGIGIRMNNESEFMYGSQASPAPMPPQKKKKVQQYLPVPNEKEPARPLVSGDIVESMETGAHFRFVECVDTDPDIALVRTFKGDGEVTFEVAHLMLANAFYTWHVIETDSGGKTRFPVSFAQAKDYAARFGGKLVPHELVKNGAY